MAQAAEHPPPTTHTLRHKEVPPTGRAVLRVKGWLEPGLAHSRAEGVPPGISWRPWPSGHPGRPAALIGQLLPLLGSLGLLTTEEEGREVVVAALEEPCALVEHL